MFKRTTTLLLAFFLLNLIYAQSKQEVKTINQASKILETDREIKVYLPFDYKEGQDYPVIYITDGSSSNFEVAKNYLDVLADPAYRLIPPSILVGIVHNERNKELDVFNRESGRKFKQYLFEEVVPYIDQNYHTSGFNVMIGHSNGAEYNHFIFLDENNPFRGFISLSTCFNTDMKAEIAQFFDTYEGDQMYFFIANGNYDASSRVIAGEQFDSLYQANSNQNIKLALQAFDGGHNSMVPLALIDGFRFIFQDYNNIKSYTTIQDYSENFLRDMKANYGIDGSYSMNDLEPYFEDIVRNKKAEDFEYLLEFIETNKLWGDGGLDHVNKANQYFLMDMYTETIEQYNLAVDNIDSVEDIVFYSNIEKAIISYEKTQRLEELIPFLAKSREQLPEKYAIYMNYTLIQAAADYGLSTPQSKEALEFCKTNYRKNNLFTKEDLDALESKLKN